jgi:hypothetical protein
MEQLTMWQMVASAFWSTLVPVAAAAVGAFLLLVVFVLPYRCRTNLPRSTGDLLEHGGLVFFGCALGLAVGVATGLSREGAVGAVVPAVLALIGALVGHVFSNPQPQPGTRFTLLVAATALVVFFIWGAFSGATARLSWEQYDRHFELYKLKYASDLELQRKQYEAQLQRVARQHEAELATYKAGRGRSAR